MLDLDLEYPFIDEMIDQLGVPYWDGMHIVTEDDFNFKGYFIPLIKDDSNSIGGFIEFIEHGDHEFYHLDIIPVSYTLLLDETLDENYVHHVITNIELDNKLFGKSNFNQMQWLLSNYKEDFNSESVESRTLVIHISYVVPLYPDGKLTGTPNELTFGFSSGSTTVYTHIHIECTDSEDPITFDPNIVNPGGSVPGAGGNVVGNGNPPLNPSFTQSILLLQTDCDDLDDGDGASTDSNSEEESNIFLNPAMIEIHEDWCYFRDKCMYEDFLGVEDLVLPINHNEDPHGNPNFIVGQLFHENTELFLELIDFNYGCVTIDDLEMVECISNAYDNLVSTYGLELTEEQERAIKKAAKMSESCGENGVFEDELIDAIATLDFEDIDAIIEDENVDEEFKCRLVTRYAQRRNPRLRPAELELIRSNWYAAWEIEENVRVTDAEVIRLFGGHQDNTCSNAFRHALWNALNAQDVGADLAKQFGDAHEDIPGNNMNNAVMDFHNNNIGIIVGSRIPPAGSDISAVVSAICSEMIAGNLLILVDPSDLNSATTDSSGCVGAAPCGP